MTTKRPNGSGNVRKRGKSWTYQFSVWDDDGRRRLKSRSGFATKAEAVEAMNDHRAKISDGRETIERAAGTVAEYLAEWTDTLNAAVVSGKRKPTTVEHHKRMVRLYLNPTIGTRPLAKLTASDLARAFVKLRESGGRDGRALSARTVHAASVTASKALRAAVREGLLPVSPFDRLSDEQRPPTGESDSEEVNAWNAEQADTFHRAAVADGTAVALALAFVLRTGLRRGELVGLRWGDIAEVERDDGRRGGEVSVRRSVVMLNGERHESTPKTKKGRRTIEVSAAVMDLLDTARARQAADRLAAGSAWEGPQAGDPDAPVFRNPDGTELHPQSLRHPLDRIAKAAKLPRHTPHDLRHTFATIALVVHRIPVVVVSEWLGHSKVSVTLDIYAHAIRSASEGYADQLGAAFDTGR